MFRQTPLKKNNMDKYTILKKYDKGGSNLGIYVLYDRNKKETFIGKHGTSTSQWRATQKLYRQSPECTIQPIEIFGFEFEDKGMMMVTEYMTGSVGDYVRNVDVFSDIEFSIIMRNVYACWKRLALEHMYVGDDFKLDNVVYDDKTLHVKFIDIDATSFKESVNENDMIQSAIGFGLLEQPIGRVFRNEPEYAQRVARIILNTIEEEYRSNQLLANLGLKTANIQCNFVQGCARDAVVMCGKTYKVFYCEKHKPK